MATYRCLSCRSLYLDPQPSGARGFHACPRDVAQGRDENRVQDRPGGPVRLRAVGAGRACLSPKDLLTGATLTDLEHLFAMAPLEPLPWPEEDLARQHTGIMPALPEGGGGER